MVIAASVNSLFLSWSPPPPVDANGELKMYLMQYRIIEQLEFGTNIPGDVGMIDDVSINPNATTLTIDNLDNYTVYEVNISAVTIIGEGPVATDTERTIENGEFLSLPPRNERTSSQWTHMMHSWVRLLSEFCITLEIRVYLNVPGF